MSTARTIGIIVFDEVLTSEVIGPAEVFALASEQPWFSGSRVLLIGVEAKPTIRTAEGITLTVDHTIADAPIADGPLDVLIVPGGSDVSHLQTNAALNAFIQQHQDAWVGSVCAGAFILGSAGVLNDHRATTWHGGESALQQQFPQVQVMHDAPVVVDNRRITANGGLVSYRAALILLAKLTSNDCTREIYDSLSISRIGDWADIEAAAA